MDATPRVIRGPVLAATDLSAGADAALQQASELAADLGAPFAICHVLPEAWGAIPAGTGEPDPRREFEDRVQRGLAARVEQAIGAVPPGVPLILEAGSPHARLLRQAERMDAGLIVLGPGRTALRVSRSARCPVLVARPSPVGGGVLGATDFSDPSLPAIHAAAEEAGRRRVPLRLVHCLDLDFTASMGVVAAPGLPGAVAMPPISPDTVRGLEAAARERLLAALAATGREGGCDVSHRGATAGILERAAAQVTGLIVVGSHGRTGLARLALGSVAEDVIVQAPCSVLVVPLERGGDGGEAAAAP